jgi:hypothetical protein
MDVTVAEILAKGRDASQRLAAADDDSADFAMAINDLVNAWDAIDRYLSGAKEDE